MLALTSGLIENGTGLLGLTLALFFIGRALRSDVRLTRRLEGRIDLLEADINRSHRRIVQLEAILRDAGLTVPPWPDDDPHTTPTRDHLRSA